MISSKGPLKIAIGQISIVVGDKQANSRTIISTIKKASEQQCDLIVFPECSLTGGLSSAAKNARRMQQPSGSSGRAPISDTVRSLTSCEPVSLESFIRTHA